MLNPSNQKQIGFLAFGLLMLFNLVSSPLNAQANYKAVCTAGPGYDIVESEEKYYLIKDDALLIFKFLKEEILIQKFDKNTLALVSSNKIAGLPPNAEFEGFHQVPGKWLFFYAVGDKKKNSFELYSREVDFSTGNLASESFQYVSSNQWGDFAGNQRKINQRPIGKSNNNYFNMKNSPDGTKMLVYYMMFIARPDEKIDDFVFGFNVYDCTNGMNKLWSREVPTSLNIAVSNFYDYAISNDGKVYAIGTTTLTEAEKKKMGDQFDKKKSELLVLQAGPESGELIYTKFDFYNMRANGVSLEAFSDGKVWVTGSFRYIDAVFQEREDVHGYFQVRIGSGGMVESKITEPVTAEISSMYYNEEELKWGLPTPPGFSTSVLNEKPVYSSGERLLVGEEVAMVSTENTHYGKNLSLHTNTVTTTTVEYPYYAINVTGFTDNGKIAYIKHLPKRQRSGRDRLSISYKYFDSGDYSYFFYMDHIKNVEIKPYKPDDVYLDQRPGFMAVYRLDRKTGNFNMIPLFDVSNVNGMRLRRVAPYSIVQSGPNEYIMEANNEKTDVLVKFTVPESAD